MAKKKKNAEKPADPADVPSEKPSDQHPDKLS